MKRQRGTILLVPVIIIAIIAVVGAYFLGKQGVTIFPQLQPTPSSLPTEVPTKEGKVSVDWKTITGKYWTFKVPKEWNYIKCSSEDSVFVDPKINKDITRECNFGAVGYLLSVNRAQGKYQIAVSSTPDPNGIYTTISNKQNITIDGQKAVKQTEDIHGSQGEGKYISVYNQKPEFTDIITFSDISKEEILNQILSTFKFLDQTSANSTANWKIYSNTIYNYSFRYPNNWFSTNCNNKNLFLLNSQMTPSCIDISGGELAFEINNKDKVDLIGDFLIGSELSLQNPNLGKDIKKYYLVSKNPNNQPGAFALYKILLDSNHELDVLVFNRSNEGNSDQILSTFKFLE